MNENAYQVHLIKRLHDIFPGCVVLKNDTSYLQGILDLTLLYGPYWALLEAKKSRSSSRQPNQDYYIERLDEMSFAAYIYPENEEEVLNALQQAFNPSRRTRLSKSQ